MLGLQSCGKFCYDIAVSRVQLSLDIGAVHYFVMAGIQKLRHSIFRVETPRLTLKTIIDTGLDFNTIESSVTLN